MPRNEMLDEMLDDMLDESVKRIQHLKNKQHLFLISIKHRFANVGLSKIGCQTLPTFRPTFVFRMSDEMSDAFDQAFR